MDKIQAQIVQLRQDISASEATNVTLDSQLTSASSSTQQEQPTATSATSTVVAATPPASPEQSSETAATRTSSEAADYNGLNYRLMKAKDAIAFLRDEESKVHEFWSIWSCQKARKFRNKNKK